MGNVAQAVKRALSSPRRRRRLRATVLAAAGMAVLAVAGLRFANTGGRDLPRTRPGSPQLVAPPPQTVPVSAEDEVAIAHVARAFVASAVLRRRVADSWPLVGPALREGLTREQWATGAIPVVPYPASDLRAAKWKRIYSYRGRVGLRVLLEPKLGARSRAEQFDLELDLDRAAAPHRWLVQSWTPAASSLEATLPPGSTPAPPEIPKARLAPVWIVLVLSVLGLIFLLPVSLAVRGWLRHRRAVRAFARTS